VSCITSPHSLPAINSFFQVLSVPPRLDILLAIGASQAGEACVCHLEAAFGYRQAFISQHLMVLREANLLTSRREGRFIFYRLTDPRILNLLALAGELLGQPVEARPLQLFSCECPNCAPTARPNTQLESTI
jgi:ArsR family transcriptional regulator